MANGENAYTKEFFSKVVFPVVGFILCGVLASGATAWYNSKNSVSREQYYQDIVAIKADVASLRKENELLTAAVKRWEDTLEKSVERLQVGFDRELSYRLPK